MLLRLFIHYSPYYSTMRTKYKSDFRFIHCFSKIDNFTLLQDSNVVPRKKSVILLYCIVFYFTHADSRLW
jgi:hypothetical protein